LCLSTETHFKLTIDIKKHFAAGRDMQKTDTLVEKATVEIGIFVDDELRDTVEVTISC